MSEQYWPGGCVIPSLPGAFLGDRTKGNGGVALALSWWLSALRQLSVSLGCPVLSLLL